MRSKNNEKVSRYLIYGLVDPRDDQLRYIGKSSYGLKRPRSEHYRVMKGYEGQGYRQNWIRSLDADGITYRIEVIQQFSESDILYDAERFWILYFRRMGCPLTNLTDGGEGTAGYRHTDEHKRKMSELYKGKAPSFKCHEAARRANLGNTWHHSEKIKRIISQANLGRKHKPESYENHLRRSKAHGGRLFVDQHGVLYRTLMQAVVATGVDKASVWAILRGRRRQGKGYVFSYLPLSIEI